LLVPVDVLVVLVKALVVLVVAYSLLPQSLGSGNRDAMLRGSFFVFDTNVRRNFVAGLFLQARAGGRPLAHFPSYMDGNANRSHPMMKHGGRAERGRKYWFRAPAIFRNPFLL
jgi:hypothetical protein